LFRFSLRFVPVSFSLFHDSFQEVFVFLSFRFCSWTQTHKGTPRGKNKREEQGEEHHRMSAVAKKEVTKKRSRFFPKKDATEEVDGPEVVETETETTTTTTTTTEEVEEPPKKLRKVEDIGGVEVRLRSRECERKVTTDQKR
jgi:hypothetical protein